MKKKLFFMFLDYLLAIICYILGEYFATFIFGVGALIDTVRIIRICIRRRRRAKRRKEKQQ